MLSGKQGEIRNKGYLKKKIMVGYWSILDRETYR